MYLIKKISAPTKLQEAKTEFQDKLPDGNSDVWGDLDSGTKREIKEALLENQKFVCCYCTCKIQYNSMKVEHWESQAKCPEKRLEWTNLFAACDGGEKSKVGPHCDSSKGSSRITLSPIRQEHINKLTYTGSGDISSGDSGLAKDLGTLNLNASIPKNGRKAAWNGFKKHLKMKNENLKKQSYRQKLIRKAKDRIDQSPATPYYDIVLFFLERK